MLLTHIPAHTKKYNDIFINPKTGEKFEVYPDYDAEDPRKFWDDHSTAIYVYNTNNNDNPDEKPPNNYIAEAFARFRQIFDKDSVDIIDRWLKIFHPAEKSQYKCATIHGYSQSEWIEVFVVIADGCGNPDSYLQEFRMWYYGDVWVVIPDTDNKDYAESALGEIYAYTPEEALGQYLKNLFIDKLFTDEKIMFNVSQPS